MSDLTPTQLVLSPRILKQSLMVALVVGIILCLINQGDALLAGRDVNMMKIGLTFLVPFLVSTYGAWNMARIAQATTGRGLPVTPQYPAE